MRAVTLRGLTPSLLEGLVAVVELGRDEGSCEWIVPKVWWHSSMPGVKSPLLFLTVLVASPGGVS